MTAIADTLGFDVAQTVLTLTFVPVLAALAAAAVAMIRNPDRSHLALGPGLTAPKRDVRHGWRHRRLTWLSDHRGKWAGRPQRPAKPLRPASVSPR